MPDHDDQIRVLQMVRLLQRRGYTVDELAPRYKVAIKTIRRDLIAIRRSGWPIRFELEDHNRRRWRVDEDVKVTKVRKGKPGRE